MLKNKQNKQNKQGFRRLVPSFRWGIPVLGLALALGIITERSTPVFSNQLDNDPYSYRVKLPDSGAYFETWREQPSNDATNDTPNKQLASPNLPTEESIITAIVPEVQRENSQLTIKTVNNYPQQDGVYLYGQSPQPKQIGQGYIIFEKNQGRVVGALYMPDSEFSCFNGNVDSSGELAMTVNPGAGETGQTQVAAQNKAPKINEDEPTSYAYSVALRDFHQINQISKLDRDILNACQNQ
ncbi:hypothetical protein NIES4071_10770 [Calothrix sp. NIES-4071]|nr:hypothetical protein NIES4071_10770 [Calothrix sp. NIES-4071]BAZ55418.1 hypothetical protein NIES4105_10730 [Calothrix sp. NIES-4105]